MNEYDFLEAQYFEMRAHQKATAQAPLRELLRCIVSEIRDIDEAYWTHRLFALVERAEATLQP